MHVHIDIISIKQACNWGEHTQSEANCIPPDEVALNSAVGDFERNGEIGIRGGGGVEKKY